MSLSKVTAPTGDVINLLSPDTAEEVVMGLDMSAMAHLVARFTDMYTDPIVATVREVVSNATDASALLPVADRKPIEITSPSAFEPMFTVTDHGVGMSTDIVKKIYSQYGASTKATNFSQIGAFGLGAKAPLSYCNEFNVVTTRDGITTTFLISRKVEGNFTKILTVLETGAPSGTTVKIPVRMQDRDRFDAALNSYRNYSFDVPVSIDGVIKDGNDDYINFDKIVLDEKSNTEGRVWVHKNSLPRLINNAFSSYRGYSNGISVRYSLSGWLYAGAKGEDDQYNRRYNNGYGYGNHTPVHDVIVEIKPGVVDFSSSRDEITANDRMESLSGKVNKLFGAGSEYLVDNVFRSYAKLNDEEGMAFVANVKDNIRVTDNAKTVVFGSPRGYGSATSTEVSRKMEFFDLASGFNPLKLVSTRHDKNLLAIINRESSDYSLYEARVDNTVFCPVYNRWYNNRGNSNIADINKRITENVEGNKNDISYVDFFVSQHFWNPRETNSVTLVTGVTVDNIAALHTHRSLIMTSLLSTRWVFYTDLDAMPTSQTELVEKINSTQIDMISADDLIEKAKAERKARLKSKAPASELTTKMSFLKMSKEHQDLSALEMLKKLDQRNPGEWIDVTVQDIIDEEALLVVGELSDIRSVLVGASNAGLKITDRPIYFTGNYPSLRAAHYAALKDYDGTVASRKWSYNSKAAEEISSKRAYSGILLDEEVAAMSEDDVISTYLGCTMRYFSRHFLQALIDVTTDENNKDALTKVHKAFDNVNRRRYGSDFATETLSKRLGSEMADRIYALTVSTSRMANKNKTEHMIVEVLLRQQEKIKSSTLNDSVMSYFSEIYENEVTEKLAATAEKAKLVAAAADAKIESDRLETEAEDLLENATNAEGTDAENETKAAATEAADRFAKALEAYKVAYAKSQEPIVATTVNAQSAN